VRKIQSAIVASICDHAHMPGLSAADDSKFIGHNSFQDVALKRYLSQTLMFLPYAAEDEVLSVIAAINRACTVHAEATLRVLSPTVEAADGAAAHADLLAVLRTCNIAWCLIFLLHAKRFLRKCYDIRDARISSFDLSSSVSKIQERAVSADGAVAASDLAVLPMLPTEIGDAAPSDPIVIRSIATACTEHLAGLLSDPALVHDLGGSTLALPAALRRQVSRSSSKPSAAKSKTSAKKGQQKKSRRKKRADSSEDEAGGSPDSLSDADEVVRAADVDSGEEDAPSTPQRRR
jgi:hypothetical protein